MSNVVSLEGSRKEIIWRCDCGCQTFFMHETGSIECAHCGATTDNDETKGNWIERLPDVPEHPAEESEMDLKHVAGTIDFAKETAFRKIMGRKDEVIILMAFFEDGSSSQWGHGLETPERLEWFDRHVAKAREFLKV